MLVRWSSFGGDRKCAREGGKEGPERARAFWFALNSVLLLPFVPQPSVSRMSISSESIPFEGPEKLLEIWFSPSVSTLPPSPPASTEFPTRKLNGSSTDEWQGLRRVPREVWEDMLDIVRCKVLSFVEGEEIDAYLLRSVCLLYFPLASKVFQVDWDVVVGSCKGYQSTWCSSNEVARSRTSWKSWRKGREETLSLTFLSLRRRSGLYVSPSRCARAPQLAAEWP